MASGKGLSTLYHMPLSRSTRPLWLYRELERAYTGSEDLPKLEVHVFDRATFRTQKPDWYLKLNPNGKVPCLASAGKDLVLWESGAICLHLLDRHDPQSLLGPRDAAARAQLWQLAFYCCGTVDNLTATSSPVQRALPGPVEWDDEERRRAWQAVCAPALEDLLRCCGGPYFAGERFGAADVFPGLCCFWLSEKKGWLEDSPALLEYYRTLIEPRPAFQASVGGTGSGISF
mmetsp:Transcript_41653/g.112432  ORF Transcript_41653/g.112432 Transcript_41653/m.112432 type:complete len:231 (-) Transcript_41653:85-777(-)